MIGKIDHFKEIEIRIVSYFIKIKSVIIKIN